MGGLDPATVAAARAAGIEDSALQEMGKLLAAKRLKKPEDAGEKPAPAGGAGLDEDDLAEDLEELNLDEPEQDGSRMEAAVLQLTKIVSTLAHPSRPSKPDLDSVLDAGVSSGSNEQQNLGQGRKSAAALRFLTKVYDENPKAIYEALERQMMLDFQVAPPKPGVPDYSGGNGTARGWLASKSRIGNFHNHIRWSWQVAGIWDDLVQNNIDRARARAGLLVACADQASIDSGSWVMSTVALLEPLPPFQEFARHTGPQPAESQISALFDPRWGEVFLQVLKDRESFNEAKQKLAQGSRIRKGEGVVEDEDEAETEVVPKGAPTSDIRCDSEQLRGAKLRGQAQGQHVPGSRAQSVDPLQVFRELGTLVFEDSGNLGSFSRSCFRTARPSREWGDFSGGAEGRVWPIPVPYGEVMTKAADKLEGDLLKKYVVNLFVIVLDFIELGLPSRAPDACLPGGWLHTCQKEQVERLEKYLDAWFELGVLGPEDMGRTAGKVEDLEAALSELAKFVSVARDHGMHQPCESSLEIGKLSRSYAGTYKEVEASRLQFRGRPDFDPRPYLDPISRRIYDFPFETSTSPSEFEGRVPRVRIHCSREQKLQLFSLLDKSGRIRLFRKEEVRAEFGAGMFAVIKSLEFDRLIMDSRPHNMLESPPGRYIMTLGAGELFTKFILEEGEVVLTSTNDIRDFYHLFRVSNQRAQRNSLVGSVHPSEVRHLSCFQDWMFGESELYVALGCLAMGDTQAVELAQTCHLGLCLQEHIVDESSLLAMSLPIPRCNTMCGIVIDDFVALSKVKATQLSEKLAPSRGALLADRAQDAYHKVHLIPHEAKAVRDSVRAEFWGVELDGQIGLVRGSLRRAAPLLKILVKVLHIGVVSVGLLEVLAGGLIALFTYRRRLMSLLEEIFEVMKGKKQHAVLVIGRKLRMELLTIAVLLPTAVSDLRAELNPEVFAVDASMWGEAVCATRRELVLSGTWSLKKKFLVEPGIVFGLTRSGEVRAFLKAERIGKLKGKATRLVIAGDSQ
ncbi:unnamed protein product, partial [Symbiodinium sp. KB8]